jgi:hypothetical protein
VRGVCCARRGLPGRVVPQRMVRGSLLRADFNYSVPSAEDPSRPRTSEERGGSCYEQATRLLPTPRSIRMVVELLTNRAAHAEKLPQARTGKIYRVRGGPTHQRGTRAQAKQIHPAHTARANSAEKMVLTSQTHEPVTR